MRGTTIHPHAELAMHTLKKTKLMPWLGALALLAACDYKMPKDAKEATASGEEMFQLCAECHGETGQGHREYNAPAIAGLPVWYIEAQLGKFKSGARGAHPADLGGLMMRPMTRSFHNDADLKAVAAYVANMPRNATRPSLDGGDAAQGQKLFAMTCANITCHKPDGSGQMPDAKGQIPVKAPPLKGTSDWYLLTQLHKFRDGVRGSSPLDIEGAAMRPQVLVLDTEEKMKDVVAYIATLK